MIRDLFQTYCSGQIITVVSGDENELLIWVAKKKTRLVKRKYENRACKYVLLLTYSNLKLILD